MNDGCLLSQAEQEKPNTMLISWKEMDTYQKAMAKMANDILSLRNKVSTLETENNNLRHQVSTQERMGNTSEEEEEIIGNMKQKLSQSSTEMRRLKDRVQQLQNELIRKNDREKDLLLMQQSHHQQQQNLRRYQDKLQKMKSLEQTVKNQEKVIQTMEKILEDKLNRSSKEREREREISETASPMGRPLGKHSSGLPLWYLGQTQSYGQIGERSKSYSDFGERAGRLSTALGPRKARPEIEADGKGQWFQPFLDRSPNEEPELQRMEMTDLESQNKGILRTVRPPRARKNRIRYRSIQSLTRKGQSQTDLKST
ncbi:coiled-coil domain-containing protein 33-like isoform X1 [Monodelphis domestica]|uniref:coiled-coil domain-containing protein 33-like isoform X1 n=1 Tax=Monodelphis domestica TaxID=13616 RepID=UPI0024E2359F|nr:coiled-coil domain-containing protein 33-like isoform X1 [Monodelphis domestica]